ncbi:hypothetical protein [Nocardia bovistercoris]|uniref:Uncharacterized protein n=1 Tax=Nocardia bovistercoris TaxID=2785916 RepID=A0A931IF51_9NOCA|nr:hypothetical protein [Nocardia bovistercoris]MBH0778645.1 hypothetical protein [Nocardia bovistercoris]
MVLDEVWRRLDGVDALSGPTGGPLRRTVKLVLDPLVIRPVQNPSCAGAVLDEDGATLLATRIHASADVLRATASWFTLLKQVRRAQRITEGNAQDLYFQRCFELATTKGAPDPDRDRSVAEETLRDIHELSAGRTTQALKQHLTDEARVRELTALVELAWRRRPATGTPSGTHTAPLTELLDTVAEGRWEGDGAEGQRLFDKLVAAHAGTHSGMALWHRESGPTARELGLTAHPRPVRPALGASASTADLALPFDRSIYERVFTVLQGSSDRADLPAVPELVTTEIARSCAPWALLDESLRVAAASGVALAEGLAPIGARTRESGELTVVDGATGARKSVRTIERRAHGGTRVETPALGFGAQTAAHRVVNGRWQREAYVLQARRLAVDAEAALAPDNPLAVIAAELRAPWRPYLRRLWVRLHGRDVREFGVYEPDELWDLLDGVARSVILDHRTKVKNALSAEAAAEASESRAG